ncbi:unnamed protein product [Hermetia illucens]|uniref:Uncharacterized protein n=2 Tax=Hermetia illucens TaxID=343691 RepID=A0A7R8Z1T6_HERIL|nr:unnamed protein product [Hermetia illucens]
MSKKLDFTNLAYREAVGRLKFLLEESYATPSKPTSQYRKHYVEDSGEDTDNQSQVTDRPPLSEISKYLSPNYKVQSAKKATPKSYSPHRSSRYSTTTDYAAPPPAPLSNETGQAPPEIISFIEKQEDYIEQLEKESKFCRDELSNLLGKVRDVISENEALTEHARSDLVASHPKISGSSESEDNHYEKIIRGRKDKPTRTSQALSGPSIVFESRISELEAELAQANIDLKKLRNENADLKRKSSLGTNAETGSFDSYRKRIESLERDKINLEETVKRLQLTIDDLRAEGNQVASKTQRSRDLADMALFEKSQAEIEIRRLKDELERQHERVRELQHEMSRRIADERANAERRYNYHVDQLDGDLSSQWEHASKLQLELERQKRLEIDFKRDLAQRNAQIEELKQELKDKKTTYLTDLAQVNAEKQALEQEITSLRLQLDKAERQGKIEAGRLNAEINSLRQRLDRADADILQVRRENLRLNDEIANLEKDLALGELKGEIRPTTKEINKSIVEMERKHADTVSELEEMIQSQRQLMDKLTAECRTLTSKLEESSLNHNKEKKELRKTNEMLMDRLKQIWSSYKEANPSVINILSDSESSIQEHLPEFEKLPLTTPHQPPPLKTSNQFPSTPLLESFHPSRNPVQTSTIHQLMIVPSPNSQHQHLPTITGPHISTEMKKLKRTEAAKNTLSPCERMTQNLTPANLTAASLIINSQPMNSSLTQTNNTPSSNMSSLTTRPTIKNNTEKQITAEGTTSPTTCLSIKETSNNMMITAPPTNRKLIYTQATLNSQSIMTPQQFNQPNKPQDSYLLQRNQQQGNYPLQQQAPNQQFPVQDSNPTQHQSPPHRQSHQRQWLHRQVSVEALVESPAISKALTNHEKAATLWGRQVPEMEVEDLNYCRNSLPRQLREYQLYQGEISPLTIGDIDPYDLIPDFEISSPSLFERSSDDDSNDTDDTLERTIIHQSS